jgi:hypothetical protein
MMVLGRTGRKPAHSREICIWSKKGINPAALELSVAKQILGEVFGVREAEVEEMIGQRIEERALRER